MVASPTPEPAPVTQITFPRRALMAFCSFPSRAPEGTVFPHRLPLVYVSD